MPRLTKRVLNELSFSPMRAPSARRRLLAASPSRAAHSIKGGAGAFGYVALQAAHAWGPSSLLLRVAHAYEADEDAGGRSAPVDVALGALFGAAVTVSACIETTLTASQPLDDAKNWTYNVTGAGAVTLPERPPPPRGDGIIVTLQPLDIRTFLCDAAFHGGQPIALAQV